jgi:hypothetical protein
MIYVLILVYLISAAITLVIWAFTRVIGIHSKTYFWAIAISSFVILPIFLLIMGYYWYLKRGLRLKLIAYISFIIPPLFFLLIGGLAARLDENRALDRKEGDLYTYIKNERLEEDKGWIGWIK